MLGEVLRQMRSCGAQDCDAYFSRGDLIELRESEADQLLQGCLHVGGGRLCHWVRRSRRVLQIQRRADALAGVRAQRGAQGEREGIAVHLQSAGELLDGLPSGDQGDLGGGIKVFVAWHVRCVNFVVQLHTTFTHSKCTVQIKNEF